MLIMHREVSPLVHDVANLICATRRSSSGEHDNPVNHELRTLQVFAVQDMNNIISIGALDAPCTVRGVLLSRNILVVVAAEDHGNRANLHVSSIQFAPRFTVVHQHIVCLRLSVSLSPGR
jgi:hypothetical protein